MKWKASLVLFVAVYSFICLPPAAGLAESLQAERSVPEGLVGRRAPADPAAAVQDLIDKGVEAYRVLDFENTLLHLNQAMGMSGATPGQVATIRKYRAFTRIGQGDPTAARAEFLEALKIDPALRLDSRLQSPEIIRVFEETREEFESAARQKDSVAPVIEFSPLQGRQPFGKSLLVQAAIRDNYRIDRAELYYRSKGDLRFVAIPFEKTAQGQYLGSIPSSAIAGDQVEYYLMARDTAGNLTFEGTRQTPHTVGIEPNPALRPWYKKWWVWAIAGLVVGGTVSGVVVATRGGDGTEDAIRTTDVTVVVDPLPNP